MRILHTSDWHLGRILYGQHLTEDQAWVLEQHFFPLLQEAQVDAVLVSGDVFDRSVPGEQAVRLWDETLTRLHRDFHIPLYVIGGNHDSGDRLACGRQLLADGGCFVEGRVHSGLTPWPLTVGEETVYICPMPYAEPHEVTRALGLSQTGYAETMQALAEYLHAQVPAGEPTIAMAHAFVIGGQPSESERPLAVGGTDAIAAEVFSDFTYTALGHLHRPQEIGSVRYSGSLLKYSFDEAKQQKSMTIVDIRPDGSVSWEAIPTQARRDVRILRGSFAELTEGAVYEMQRDKGLSLDDYLLAELTDAVPVVDAMARLRRLYPNMMGIVPVGRVLRTELPEVSVVTPTALSQEALFRDFAQFVEGEGLSPEEDAYIQAVWQEVRKEDA